MTLLLVWLCLLGESLVYAETFPSNATVSGWVNELDKVFNELTSDESDITGASRFQEVLQSSLSSEFRVYKANGKELVDTMAVQIAEIFKNNTDALKLLQGAAEKAVREYDYNFDLTLDQVSYVDMNDMANVSKDMQESVHFDQEIYTETSGVHIPIEIYEGYNSNQMSRICPSCTSQCDLCQNGLFWRQESRFGITNFNIVEDPEILNGIRWSQKLNEAFKANREAYPDIYWQSFGSQEGFLRVYPAARWRSPEDLPDLFDVRRRPWYIHGSVSPKDMIILLDTSGSMHGQSFDIMKLAAKTLVNTLGENDYVNVAQFSRNVTWVTPCLDTLVQANSRNKRLLFDGIDRLVDHQIASYADALTFAYEQLEAFERLREQEEDPQEGADCHKLIMVFSDGGTEYPNEVIDFYKNASNPVTEPVRIFTYAVGPHPLPTVALKNMACSTGGAFTTITAMGSIRTKIQSSYLGVIARSEELNTTRPVSLSTIYVDNLDYARVLNKPLVLANAENFINSVFFSRDHLGLGLVTTITLPVFNTSKDSNGQTLAGVAGIDIPVSTLMALSPRSKLGPLGYTFGLNSNGFLIFHPYLWLDANFLEDPAHIDIADIEGENENVEELRKSMIDIFDDVEPGKVIFAAGKVSDIESMLPLQGAREYHFTKVQGAGFTLGLAVDPNWRSLEVPIQSKADILSLPENSAHVADWNYCRSKERIHTLAELKAALQNPNATCESAELERLAWDSRLLAKPFSSLIAGYNPHIESRFLVTEGGLTLIDPSTTMPDYQRILNNPHNSSIYRHVASYRKAELYVLKYTTTEIIPDYLGEKQDEDLAELTVSDDAAAADTEGNPEGSAEGSGSGSGEEDEDENGCLLDASGSGDDESPDIIYRTMPASIFLVKPVLLEASGEEIMAGVAGVHLKDTYLQDMLLSSTREVPREEGRSGVEWSCSNSSELACYLLDYSANILSSNVDLEEVEAGEFLGLADPLMMQQLVEEHKLFRANESINYQALCPDDLECSLGVRSVFIPTIHSIVYAIQNIAYAIQNAGYVFWSFLSMLSFATSPSEAISEYGFEMPEGLHRCASKSLQWHLNPDAINKGLLPLHKTAINKECPACRRQYHVYGLKSIKALLLVADAKCQACHQKPFAAGVQEVLEFRYKCLLPKRYRKRPEKCYATDENEQAECNAGAGLLPLEFLFLLIPFLISVILRGSSNP